MVFPALTDSSIVQHCFKIRYRFEKSFSQLNGRFPPELLCGKSYIGFSLNRVIAWKRFILEL